MRIITEIWNGQKTYVYIETEKNFRKNERTRQIEGLRRIPFESLADECLLSSYGDNVYTVSPKLPAEVFGK